MLLLRPVLSELPGKVEPWRYSSQSEALSHQSSPGTKAQARAFLAQKNERDNHPRPFIAFLLAG